MDDKIDEKVAHLQAFISETDSQTVSIRRGIDSQMVDLKTEVFKELSLQVNNVKKVVEHHNDMTAAHRKTLQSKYDSKLTEIKQTCTAYFSKSDEHLGNFQNTIKQLEVRQEEWVNRLIKPSELN